MEFKLKLFEKLKKIKFLFDFKLLKKLLQKIFLKRSIKSTLMIQFFILISLVVIFFEIFLIFTIKNYYYSAVTGILESQARYSVNLYKTHLSNYSLSEVILNDRESFYKDVYARVQILNNLGQVLLDTTDGKSVGNTLNSKDVLTALEGKDDSLIYRNNKTKTNELAISMPISNNNEQLGVARFIISMKNIDNMITQRYLIFFLFGFFVLLISVGVSILMSKKIISPIQKLTTVALKLKDGRLSEKADETGDYEIKKLGITLNLMSENLIKKEQLKKDFISSISHELRTPLTVIKGWAFTLKPEAKDNKLLEDGLTIIEKESDRLGNMVNDLLDFSEISSGRMIMNKEMIDLTELSIFINKQLMPKSIQKGIDMITNYDEKKHIIVMADRDRIKQVLINILDNSLKFTKEGGIILTDIKAEKEIAIVEITDNGCGISKEEINLVTGKFYKGSNSNSHTGLGLSICEEIIKAHNGNLIIKSVIDKGTMVRIELPLEREETISEA